jgi:hypothetical protein
MPTVQDYPPEFWKGYVSGTNRGTALLRISSQNGKLTGKAIIGDQDNGSTIVSLDGTLVNGEGEIELKDFVGWAPLIALYGTLKVTFRNDFPEAEGTWKTDIDTQGTCKFRPEQMLRLSWTLCLINHRLQIFVRQYFAGAYLFFLLTIGVLATCGVVEVSWQALVLLLIPAPYLFKRQIVEMFQTLKVRKLGFVELEQGPVPDEIRFLIARQVQETIAYVLLDGFFVPRTKAMLLWIVQNERVDRRQFDLQALSIGVPPDNLDATWNALLLSGCGALVDGWIVPTPLGPTIRALSERRTLDSSQYDPQRM